VRKCGAVFSEGAGPVEEFGKLLLALEGLMEFSCVSFGRVVHDDVSVFRVFWAVVEHVG